MKYRYPIHSFHLHRFIHMPHSNLEMLRPTQLLALYIQRHILCKHLSLQDPLAVEMLDPNARRPTFLSFIHSISFSHFSYFLLSFLPSCHQISQKSAQYLLAIAPSTTHFACMQCKLLTLTINTAI